MKWLCLLKHNFPHGRWKLGVSLELFGYIWLDYSLESVFHWAVTMQTKAYHQPRWGTAACINLKMILSRRLGRVEHNKMTAVLGAAGNTGLVNCDVSSQIHIKWAYRFQRVDKWAAGSFFKSSSLISCRKHKFFRMKINLFSGITISNPGWPTPKIWPSIWSPQ